MPHWMIELVVLCFVFFLGLVAGPYLRGYATKRGENLATHDDIDKLVDQVEAVTKATEAIKAEISSGLWDRQRRWEMKREVVFAAAKRLSEIDDALLSNSVVLKADAAKQAQWKLQAPSTAEELSWAETKHDRLMRWIKASMEFDESRAFMTIVCSKEVAEAFHTLGAFITKLASEMTENPSRYDVARSELFKKILLAKMAMRKELDVDVKSQSNDSWAAPTPAPQSPEAK